MRQACDAYVELVRHGTLLEAVAASLTEVFAPALMQRRLQAWQQHYPWVPSEALDYFRVRIDAAKQDSVMALDFVVQNATTPELERQAIRALVRKTELLWQMADAIDAATRGKRGVA